MFFKLTMSLVGYSLVEFLAADLLDLVVSSAWLEENAIIVPPAAALVVLPACYEAIFP